MSSSNDISRTGFFYTSAQQKRSLFMDIRGTGETIVSTLTLFWRISINDPLNEPLLYLLWLSWRKLWRGKSEMARGSKDWNQKTTIEI